MRCATNAVHAGIALMLGMARCTASCRRRMPLVLKDENKSMSSSVAHVSSTNRIILLKMVRSCRLVDNGCAMSEGVLSARAFSIFPQWTSNETNNSSHVTPGSSEQAEPSPQQPLFPRVSQRGTASAQIAKQQPNNTKCS